MSVKMAVYGVLLLGLLVVGLGCGSPSQTPSASPSASFSISAAAPAVSQPLGVVFGDQLELVGLNLPTQIKKGVPFDIEMVWHCLKQPDRNFRIAVLLDYVSGKWWRYSMDDRPPFPTIAWPAGQYVTIKETGTFPAGAGVGQYRITVHPFNIIANTRPQRFDRPAITKQKTSQFGEVEVTAE